MTSGLPRAIAALVPPAPTAQQVTVPAQAAPPCIATTHVAGVADTQNSAAVPGSVTIAALADCPTRIDVARFGCNVPNHVYAFRAFGGGIELGTFGPRRVRPVTFWAQAIPITAAGFEATGTYRIQAN